MKNKQKSENWSDFFAYRDLLLNYIHLNATPLYTINRLYKYVKHLNTGNREEFSFIREILHLPKTNVEEYEYMLHELHAKREELVEKKTKRLPFYFPTQVKNANQINISENPAYFSKVFTREYPLPFLAFRVYDKELDQIDLDLGSLRKENIYYYTTPAADKNDNKYFWVTLHNEGVFDYFNIDKIKMRYRTGTQYIARVLFKGQSLMQRKSLGLMVCTGEQPSIYRALPQKRRSHAGKLKKNELKLPLPPGYYTSLDFFIYKVD